MKKLYEKQAVWFAVAWIVLYCAIIAPLRGEFGDDSPRMLLALAVFAAAIAGFTASLRLGREIRLTGWPEGQKRLLWLLPMWLLTTGNLWGGFSWDYEGVGNLYAILSMLLVGFIEEMLFRGFLFHSMLQSGRERTAVIVSALTFGMGHIVNLLSGQGGAETLVQIAFAVSWGFVFTLVYLKGGRLLPCILSHALIDAFSVVSTDYPWADWSYIIATIVIGAAYSVYLAKLPSALPRKKSKEP